MPELVFGILLWSIAIFSLLTKKTISRSWKILEASEYPIIFWAQVIVGLVGGTIFIYQAFHGSA